MKEQEEIPEVHVDLKPDSSLMKFFLTASKRSGLRVKPKKGRYASTVPIAIGKPKKK